MELRIHDIVNLLNVPEKKVHKWIKEKSIPFETINHEYRFNITKLEEWVLENRMPVTQQFLDLVSTGIPMKLSELITRGGILYDVPGTTMKDALTSCVSLMKKSADMTNDMLLSSLLEREELLPTAVGNGIAIPHPRNPLITNVTSEQVTLAYLNSELDTVTPDNIPVHALFIVLSANHRRHLEILSRLAFFCQNHTFLHMLLGHPHDESIIALIKEHE